MEDYNKKIGFGGEIVGNVGIAVHKDYRRKGIGKMLMQKAIQEAKELGATVLIAVVSPENIASIRFHEKLGFKEHTRLKKGDRLGMHTVAKDHTFMKLDLQ